MRVHHTTDTMKRNVRWGVATIALLWMVVAIATTLLQSKNGLVGPKTDFAIIYLGVTVAPIFFFMAMPDI